MIQKSPKKKSFEKKVQEKKEPAEILQGCSCPSDKNLLFFKILGVSNDKCTLILVKFAAS